MASRQQRCIIVWHDNYFGPFYNASQAYKFAKLRNLTSGWRIVELLEPVIEK